MIVSPVVFHFRDERSFPSRFYSLYTFDAFKLFKSLLFLYLLFCSFSSPAAFYVSHVHLYLFVFFSFRGVSPLLNESSDLFVSFTGLFNFVFLRLRHNISSLCFFNGCCCVCIFTQAHVAAAVMLASSSDRVLLWHPQQFFHPRVRTQWTRQMHSQSNGVLLLFTVTSLPSSCADSPTILPDLIFNVYFVISCFCVVAAISAVYLIFFRVRHSVLRT